MFGSQLASLGHLCIGFVDGAKHMFNEIFDHPLHTLSELADGIPVVGHIKGVVHLAMGDTEAAIHSEESASRTLVVLGAAALTGATGGAAAPVLAGVVGGILADGILTGIESSRTGHYDPQGIIDISTNVVRDVQKGNTEGLGSDIFDGVVLAAGDGMVGASSMKGTVKPGKTTRIFRVEGRSLVRNGDGSELAHFRAGDNQRVFHYKGAIAPRERLPQLSDPESLRTGHLPAEPTIPPEDLDAHGRRGGRRGGIDPSREDMFLKAYAKDFFDDHGKMIFLNFGEEDRMYGYYAQKLIDHRELVSKYRALFEKEKNRSSTVTERTHQIRVKSFEVLTRDLDAIEQDAVTENQRRTSSYRGVLKVDTKSPRQYGLESSRYTPIFNKVVAGSFEVNRLWIRHLPTSVLRIITEHPVAFGRVRRFKYLSVGGGIATHSIVPIKDLHGISASQPVGYDDVVPQALVHCRHVKTIQPATSEDPAESFEHYEYLVKFNENSPAEWYPEDLVAPDLRKDFYNHAMASAKPVSSVKSSPNGNGKLLVERPNGSWDEIDPHQIFWREQESGADSLGLRELDSIMYHLYREDANHGTRVRLHTNSLIPNEDVVHAAPCAEKDHKPVYLASALNFKGGVHPCKVVPSLGPSAPCRVPYGGQEIYHHGEYDLLPFVPELMEFVDANMGSPPPSRRPILGGYEGSKKLYHAIGQIEGVWVPGKAGPQFGGAMIPYGDKENWTSTCKIL
ncbi:uncharacterized protein F4817DRAFT_367011 [Daldinia loculata]|uniref:uncharacterized protein n=1 Tax=Daldinia loculata TaxID=103429 RepID=UPI0020C418FE|nr:uncharacterized protein F4817DRAFT_367011 [Daldinia loculata]KAI1645145.1 hypothetical protein F4817DRAFT_367011 [Daldinia loculata]